MPQDSNNIQIAETVLACPELDETLAFFVRHWLGACISQLIPSATKLNQDRLYH